MAGDLCLLTVHAHPDDEASKGACTLAKYGAEGVRTVLVCCTGGEEGDILNPAMDRPEVRDNLAETTFEPWTEATRAWAVARLTLALEDLRSMITPHEVTCGLDSHPELRQVYIEFSDVRGQVRSSVVGLEIVDTADDDPG